MAGEVVDAVMIEAISEHSHLEFIQIGQYVADSSKLLSNLMAVWPKNAEIVFSGQNSEWEDNYPVIVEGSCAFNTFSYQISVDRMETIADKWWRFEPFSLTLRLAEKENAAEYVVAFMKHFARFKLPRLIQGKFNLMLGGITKSTKKSTREIIIDLGSPDDLKSIVTLPASFEKDASGLEYNYVYVFTVLRGFVSETKIPDIGFLELENSITTKSVRFEDTNLIIGFMKNAAQLHKRTPLCGASAISGVVNEAELSEEDASFDIESVDIGTKSLIYLDGASKQPLKLPAEYRVLDDLNECHNALGLSRETSPIGVCISTKKED